MPSSAAAEGPPRHTRMSDRRCSIWRFMKGRQIWLFLRVGVRCRAGARGSRWRCKRWCGRARSPPSCGRAAARSGRRTAGPRCPRRGRALRPTNITLACGLPSANTSRFAVKRSPQPSKLSSMARSTSRLVALFAASRAAMMAASGPAARRGRRAAGRAAVGWWRHCSAIERGTRSRRCVAWRRCRVVRRRLRDARLRRFGEPVDRLVPQHGVDAAST